MSLPKVLIIGQAFNNDFGGGITQANLFGDWSKDKMAVVCTDHMFNNLNTDICDTYYLLGSEEYKWTFPFNLLQRNVTSGVRKISDRGVKQGTVSAKAKFRTTLIDKYFYPFLEWVGLFHRLSKITLSDKLRKWVDEYNPDFIYAQAASREAVLFCVSMQEYIKKPMVYHVMDDWPSTISQKGPFKNYWHNKIDRELKILLSKSTVLLSISDEMAQEYKRRYGRNFVTFHNPIETGFWKSHQRKNYDLSETPAVLYAGRIGTGIQSSLESMAKAIDLVNKRFNKSLQFILQTKDKPSWVENYNCVQHKSLVAYSELPKVFSEADFLFLPYDFSVDSIKFIKYSMPTKAPEYMMSGTPVIIFAPEETALVINAKKGHWAKVITEDNIDALSESINALVSDKDYRNEIAENAIAIAETKFNTITVRNNFRETIVSMLK